MEIDQGLGDFNLGEIRKRQTRKGSDVSDREVVACEKLIFRQNAIQIGHGSASNFPLLVAPFGALLGLQIRTKAESSVMEIGADRVHQTVFCPQIHHRDAGTLLWGCAG